MLLDSEENARTWIGVNWGPGAVADLDRLAELLRAESTRQNLVSPRSLQHVWVRHFADSAQLVDIAPAGQELWLDIGSGAGFPGLVVAVLDRSRKVMLVEQRKLRVDWLRSAIRELGLHNCEVIQQRVETMATVEAAVISARAFAPLRRTLVLAGRFSTANTCWLLPKGATVFQELETLPRKLRGMFHVKRSRTDAEAGIIIGAGEAR
ncbi:16S rRNA (guanine(527)-N(7))-methyltransferase RsmG [Qipengyuania sediminis]|uniref:16S rRNA (guanine(527)-N(7))-methyltransferase RsmG n=1 Tax=Qipengyuania sediminis TaxID=1532023 RepID=UPI00105928EE|nr:16S rRNA (guanine(527)-N(7))-methyltransferase RsmG [Qipengyuania sediminis]